MSKTVTTISGKTYELVNTDETGNLMTVKDGSKEIQIPTANVEKIGEEESNLGAIAVVGGLALFAFTGMYL
jgi:hypothetical protein